MSSDDHHRISHTVPCQCCADLDPVEDASVGAALSAVWASAGSGCESCALVRDAIIECAPETVLDSQNRVVIRRSILRHFIELAIQAENPTRTIVLDLFVTADECSPWRSIRVGVETSGNTVSLASFRNVENWLAQCLQKHESCQTSPISTLPSRVLDLRSNEPDIVLCEPRQKKAGYVCLSHCWGDARGITTTNVNLEAFKGGITFQGLPRTFQEAIIFTRKLGIQYLWIDSLCIIQDDELDWQRESTKMASIYANSYLTLAATGSSSDLGGLFATHSKTKLSGVYRDGSSYEVHVRPVIYHNKEANFPLLKRGWVFQERLLAPRVLHFGSQEIWWECLEKVDCECSGIHSQRDRYTTGQEKFLSKLTHQRALADSALPQVSRRWHAIVEEFSELALTKSRDKLPALSGIAEQIQALRGGDYLAGVWSDTLVQDLLWYRTDLSTVQHPDKWRGPSWSWVALDGSVKFFDSPHFLESSGMTRNIGSTQSLKGIFVEVVDASTRTLSGNRFGEVTAAHLQLIGFLVPISVFDPRSRSGSSRTLGRRVRHNRLHYEFRFENEEELISFSFFADYDLRVQDAEYDKHSYSLLSVAEDESGDDHALVLKCIGSSQNIYERVGFLTTKFQRWRSPEHLQLYNLAFKKSSTPREITMV